MSNYENIIESISVLTGEKVEIKNVTGSFDKEIIVGDLGLARVKDVKIGLLDILEDFIKKETNITSNN